METHIIAIAGEARAAALAVRRPLPRSRCFAAAASARSARRCSFASWARYVADDLTFSCVARPSASR